MTQDYGKSSGSRRSAQINARSPGPAPQRASSLTEVIRAGIDWCGARVASGMLLLVCLWICSFGFQLCSAHDDICTVTKRGGQTLYTVPEFKGTDCHHRWSESDNHVLANQVGKADKLVEMQNSSRLLTNGCFERIHYHQGCLPEGIREAICTTECSGNAGPQSGGEPQTSRAPTTPETKTPGSRHHWIVVVVGVILLLVVLILFLRYRKRMCVGNPVI